MEVEVTCRAVLGGIYWVASSCAQSRFTWGWATPVMSDTRHTNCHTVTAPKPLTQWIACPIAHQILILEEGLEYEKCSDMRLEKLVQDGFGTNKVWTLLCRHLSESSAKFGPEIELQ